MKILLFALLGSVVLLERVVKLRPPTRRLSQRLPANAALGAVSGIVAVVGPGPLARALARRHRIGLSALVPRPLRGIAAFALLDLSMWLWHKANHDLAPLWRFHQVHHADPDLDTTTAIRFHPGEIAASTAFRAAQVLIIAPSPAVLATFDGVVAVAVLFHHANLRVPGDRAWSRLVITPRLHTVHHDKEHVETNFGIVFSVWDALFGTRAEMPLERVRFGAPDTPHTTSIPDAFRVPAGAP